VTESKARRLRRLAVRWLDERDWHADEVRFDVIGVLPAHGGFSIEHLRGVI
jgi:putative endonuclease